MKLALTAIVLMGMAQPALAAGGDSPFVGTLYQAIAAAVVFLTLFFVLKAKAWGPILNGLQDRETKIQGDLADAERAAKQAQDTLQEYQHKLAEAHEDAKKIIDDGRQAAEKIAAQLKSDTENDIKLMRDRAAADIETAKDAALSDLYAQTASLATQVAGRILRRELNVDDQQQIIQQSIEELGSGGANN